MRIVEVLKDIERNGVKMTAGKKFVMADDVEYSLRAISGDSLGLSYPLEQAYKPYQGQDLTGKKLMTWRSGGIGDMYFWQPVLIYLKKKYKGLFLRVASGCKQPLENIPEIDELYDVPFDATLLEGMDFHLIYQGILETASEKSKKKHAVDMFFDYCSIDSTQFSREDKLPKIVYTQAEMDWLKQKEEALGLKKDDFVIGFQMESSASLRNPPRGQMKTVVDVLAKEPGVKVVLVGAAESKALAGFYKGNSPNVIMAVDNSPRQSIVLANRYDMVFGPDSFLLHTAGALRKPMVGLYGPFPSELRLAYFENAIGLEAKVPCSPCFVHDSEPCIKGYPSPCFSLMETADILQAIDYQKNKLTGTHFDYMRELLSPPDLSEIEKYFLSADKGLCFFGGYFRHHNILRIDTNVFAKPDISDLSTEFKRNYYPFVLYMEQFNQEKMPIYQGSKGLVRPGGYFVVYKTHADEKFIDEAKRDIGRSGFTLVYAKLDPVQRYAAVVGKKTI